MGRSETAAPFLQHGAADTHMSARFMLSLIYSSHAGSPAPKTHDNGGDGFLGIDEPLTKASWSEFL